MANQNEVIFHLIDDIVSNNNLTHDDVANILKYALTKAYNKIYTDKKIEVDVDFEQKLFSIKEELKVVSDEYYEEDGNDDCEIPLTVARKINPNAQIDDIIVQTINPKSFEPTMIRSVLQLFKQKVSESTNEKIYAQWKDKKGTIISGKVEMTDPNKNFSFVEFSNTKGFVSAADKIPGEILEIGKIYKFYVKDVREQTKGWPIILSRSDAGFIKGLIKLEVPEVAQDIIKIQNIARIPGFKTKVSVESVNKTIDPISTCIGQRGSRIQAILREINNKEKIEFIKYYEDPIKFIASACLPSKIDGVYIISSEEKSATIVANKGDLSLIIGMKGKNISLISRLTGWSLDVRSRQEAIKDNINFTSVDSNFYERERTDKPYIHQFASTNDILRNLQETTSYAEIQKTFNIKDNESTNNENRVLDSTQIDKFKDKNLDEIRKLQKEDDGFETRNINKNIIQNNDNLVEEELSENDIKNLQDMINGKTETKPESIVNENRKIKVDYNKLRTDGNKLNSLEEMLSEKKIKPKQKFNFKKKNDNKSSNEKIKKKNILDEFDDVTKDYLLSDNSSIESYEDDNDDYEDYDLDDYED